MKFVLTPIGSGGDVFPFLGLALALRERGHEVAMISSGHFGPLIEGHGIPFDAFGTDEDYLKAIQDPNIFHPIRGFRTVINFVREQRRLMALIEKHTSKGAIIIHHTIAFAARLLQEAGRAHVISIVLQPAVLRSVHEGPVLNGNHGITKLPRPIQRGIWWAVDRFLVDPPVAAILDDLRSEMGLPKVRSFLGDWGHSPDLTIGVFPEWFAPSQPDWPLSVKLTSFPLCDHVASRPTPLALANFMEHQRPLVFTPGTGNTQAHQFFEAAVEACRLLGLPGVLLTSHHEHLPSKLPPGVCHCDFAPLSQILPQCAGLVHHGGIGTTASALAAGVPQIIMPLSHDQPDNAARIVRNGWGGRLWPRQFTAKRLTPLLRSILTSSSIATNCRTAAERLSTSNGLEQTCNLICDKASRWS